MKEIDYINIQRCIPKSEAEWDEFILKVKDLQKNGWCCIGNMVFDGIYVYREMVKYEPEILFSGVIENPAPVYIKFPKKEKKEPVQTAVEYLSLADYFIDLIKTIGGSPNVKISDAQKNKWANEFRLMVDRDGFEVDWIHATLKKVFEAPGSGSFAWRYVIRSAKKFREHVKAGKLDHLFAEKLKKGNVELW
jgi:hypothetical protein